MTQATTTDQAKRKPGRPALPLILRKPFADYRAHAAACESCRHVDLQYPATLVNACLTGSKLIKEAANFAHLNRRRKFPA